MTSTLVSLEELLKGQTDSRPECERHGCSKEALWHLVWEHPCPCPWVLCQQHKEVHDQHGFTAEYKCSDCKQYLGKFRRWERT